MSSPGAQDAPPSEASPHLIKPDAMSTDATQPEAATDEEITITKPMFSPITESKV